jgi:putative ABC transport system permease protein
MATVLRGVRNVTRNPARSLLVIVLVALSVSVVVATAAVNRASASQVEQLREQVATLLQVNPPGVAPGGGSAAGLPASLGAQLADVAGVVAVDPYVRRQFVDNANPVATGVLNGVVPGSELRLSAMGGFTGTPQLVRGRGLRPGDEGSAVAVVGRVFAQQNGLDVGSRFTLPAELLAARGDGPPRQDVQAEVVGVFSVDVAFGDNQVFVPLHAAQAALGVDDQVTQFWVQAESVEQVEPVQRRLSTLLGDRADVLASAPQAQRASASISALASSAAWAGAISAAVGGLIVLLTMVLTTRERRREIGVLKALGASNATVAAQFVAESVALAVLGGVVGAGMAAVGGSVLAQAVLGGADGLGSYPVPLTSAAVGIGLALLFGVIGSLYPVQRAMRLRPSDAIRTGA